MNHIKQFFKEKGLYLFCLAMVFAATAAGILALRSIVGNVADLTRIRKEALQDDSVWTQPDAAIDKPAEDVPKPTQTPAAAEKPAATAAPEAAQTPAAKPADRLRVKAKKAQSAHHTPPAPAHRLRNTRRPVSQLLQDQIDRLNGEEQ